MKYRALVPVKALTNAKSRLAPYLAQRQRETLVLDMLHHVLRVLLDSQSLEQVAVVSADTQVLKQAEAWGARPVPEEQHEHNAALHAAASRQLHEGAGSLLTISADLPLLSTGDVHALIEQSAQHEVVLAPSHEGTGTNAILVRPPLAVPYLFGVNSLEHYIQAARERHLNAASCHSPGLSLDIDSIEDLHRLEVLRRAGSGTGGSAGKEHLPGRSNPCHYISLT